MQEENEIIQRIIRWGEGNEHIRSMLLTSTRAIDSAPIDRFSDYDVVLVANDLEAFLQDEGWLQTFGDVMVRFNDQFSWSGFTTYTRLVLYEDGLKIDFSLWPIELLQQIVTSPTLPDDLDWGYRILLDKDHLVAGLKTPTCSAYIPQKPTLQEYLTLVNEFWWETTYVARNLWRDELFFAKYNLEVINRERLLTLLEWHLEISNHWGLKTGIHGRGLKQHIDPQLWSEIEATFAGADIEENWQALLRMTELFRKLAIQVGTNLGYDYPQALDDKVSAYLCQVHST